MILQEINERIKRIEEKALTEGLVKSDYYILKGMLTSLDSILLENDYDYQLACLRINNLLNCIHENSDILYKYNRKTVEYLLKRVSLLPLVLADCYYQKVKMKGPNGYMFLCPYHYEHTPSFRVKDYENSFRCFGCGSSGNVFNYMELINKIEFKDAVDLLLKVYLYEEESKNDKYHNLISKYQKPIISDSYIKLLEMGKERIQRYNLDFMPNSNWLVSDFYEDRFREIARIRNKEKDPNFKKREPVKKLKLSYNTIYSQEFCTKYAELKESQNNMYQPF